MIIKKYNSFKLNESKHMDIGYIIDHIDSSINELLDHEFKYELNCELDDEYINIYLNIIHNYILENDIILIYLDYLTRLTKFMVKYNTVEYTLTSNNRSNFLSYKFKLNNNIKECINSIISELNNELLLIEYEPGDSYIVMYTSNLDIFISKISNMLSNIINSKDIEHDIRGDRMYFKLNEVEIYNLKYRKIGIDLIEIELFKK